MSTVRKVASGYSDARHFSRAEHLFHSFAPLGCGAGGEGRVMPSVHCNRPSPLTPLPKGARGTGERNPRSDARQDSLATGQTAVLYSAR